MQNLISLSEINKRILPLEKKIQHSFDDDHTRYFSTFDFYPFIYEESITLLIELAIMMRRQIDFEKEYDQTYDYGKIKYPNIGKYADRPTEIGLYKALSKIIHADTIEFEVIGKDGSKGYGYLMERDCYFSENALITGREKGDSQYSAIIDTKKLCINAFMMNA